MNQIHNEPYDLVNDEDEPELQLNSQNNSKSKFNDNFNRSDNREHQMKSDSNYESCQTCFGECFSHMRIWLPCICCCCPYPYQLVKQGQVGILEYFGKYSKILDPGYHRINWFTSSLTYLNMKTMLIDLNKQVLLIISYIIDCDY